MKAVKYIAGILLATFGVFVVIGAVELFAAPDPQIPSWAIWALLIILGLPSLAGAFFLLRSSIIAPGKPCPGCGSMENKLSNTLQRRGGWWAIPVAGWISWALWRSSRGQIVRCVQCETVYTTHTRGTRIAQIFFLIFMLIFCFGIAAAYFQGGQPAPR